MDTGARVVASRQGHMFGEAELHAAEVEWLTEYRLSRRESSTPTVAASEVLDLAAAVLAYSAYHGETPARDRLAFYGHARARLWDVVERGSVRPFWLTGKVTIMPASLTRDEDR